MTHGLAAPLLIALSLTMTVPAAMAKEEPLPAIPHDEVILPDSTPPQSKPETEPGMPITGPHGQLLYENHCQGCHTSVVHVRETHSVRSMMELQVWVIHWVKALNLPWSADDVHDVIEYLNQRYYKFK